MIQENIHSQTKENVQGRIQKLKERLLYSPVSGVKTINELKGIEGVEGAEKTPRPIKKITINVAAALKQKNNSK